MTEEVTPDPERGNEVKKTHSVRLAEPELWLHQAKCRPMDWAAVQELELSYHNGYI